MITTLSPVIRYDVCYGLKLYKFGMHTGEIWFVPPGYRIVAHKHDDEDISLTFLYGQATFCKIESDRERKAVPSRFGQTFNIPPGCIHWFETTRTWLIFANFAVWSKQPTATSVNFQVT